MYAPLEGFISTRYPDGVVANESGIPPNILVPSTSAKPPMLLSVNAPIRVAVNPSPSDQQS